MIRDLVLNKAFLEIDCLELEYINGGVNWYQVLTVVDTVLFWTTGFSIQSEVRESLVEGLSLVDEDEWCDLQWMPHIECTCGNC